MCRVCGTPGCTLSFVDHVDRDAFFRQVKAELVPIIEQEVTNQIRWKLKKLFKNVHPEDMESLRAMVMRELD